VVLWKQGLPRLAMLLARQGRTLSVGSWLPSGNCCASAQPIRAFAPCDV